MGKKISIGAGIQIRSVIRSVWRLKKKKKKLRSMEEEQEFQYQMEPQTKQVELVEREEEEVEKQQQHLQKHRRQLRLQPGAEEKLVLQFMDSTHNYLSLFHDLSSTLRQGWLELASARHSMGASRINSRLLDLNFHSAATTLKIAKCDTDGTQPCFMLRKWLSSEHESTQLEEENVQPQDSNKLAITKNVLGLANDDEIQKERSKSLSVFGFLISPKLRATQLSFERALETLVEIANMQSSLQYSFNQLQEEEDTKE